MRVEEAVRRYQRGLNVVGHALLSPENDRRENVINDINGTETDCILSVLSSPYQEEFIADTRALLSAKVWFGCGKVLEQSYDERRLANRIKYFFMKKYSGTEWNVRRTDSCFCEQCIDLKCKFSVKSSKKCIKNTDFLFPF